MKSREEPLGDCGWAFKVLGLGKKDVRSASKSLAFRRGEKEGEG